MNILVCIKQVPGSTKVEVDDKTGVLKRDGIDSKLNPYDLYAIESSLRIKEIVGGTITAITMGPMQASEILREAYSMGVDEGVILSDRKFAGADCLATSYTLFQGIKNLPQFDLIICGKQTTDGDTAQVGSELAEFLAIPHVSNVKSIKEINEKSLMIEMDMANTVEVAVIATPCLITVEKDIYPPRLPSYKKKTATRDKEIKVFSINDFSDTDEKNYGLNASPTQVERIFPPEADLKHEILSGSGQQLGSKIAEKLNELKFI